MNQQQAQDLAEEIRQTAPACITTRVAEKGGGLYRVHLSNKEHLIWIDSDAAWKTAQEYVHLLGYEQLLVSIYDLLKHEVSDERRTEIRKRIKDMGLFTTENDVPPTW